MDAKNKIISYLDEIAQRLWAGHASIMIGAGFSKNADKVGDKDFPDWKELGDAFYDKLNPYSKNKSNYLNPLKMAGEIEAAFGRAVLDKIIREQIPDTNFSPSDLHINLLKLPWVDVFTTNYDTLLERAAEKVVDYKYETIINKEDLVWSSKPRIIKLHGSLPSKRPFVITEEDYRKYPQDCAIFINTVQQSLIENTLCLLGFSGDDPNFLNWIGWIRDNLGQSNAPKIYLLGLLNLSVGEEQLLQKRNIIPINLKYLCSNKDCSHKMAIEKFVEYMNTKNTLPKKIEWGNLNYISSIKENDIPNYILALTSQRKNYPGWIVLPSRKREILSSKVLREDLIYKIKTNIFKKEEDIQYLYEFNWLLEKALIPIFSNWIEYYEYVIEKYKKELIEKIINNNQIIKQETIEFFWIELNFALLRLYREDGIDDKRITILKDIEKLKLYFTDELLSKYHYEKCLKSLFDLNIPLLKKELDEWNTNVLSMPYWSVRKAGLLAEIGYIKHSENLVEEALNVVRMKLNFSNKNSEYNYLSMEAYILQLLKYLKDSDLNHFKENQEYKENYSKRWKELSLYECDPWRELQLFEIELKNPIQEKEEIKQTFDIGKITITTHVGNDNEYIVKKFNFLRYFEEIGFPFKINNVTLGQQNILNVIEIVSMYSPVWAMVTLIRSGNSKFVDSIFNRKKLSFIQKKEIDKKIIQYVTILNENSSNVNMYEQHFTTSLFIILPEILSRLCVKSSYEIKIKLLDFIKNYLTKNFKVLDGFVNLCKRLITSFSNKEQYELIPELLTFPILDEKNMNFFNFDIFDFIAINKPISNVDIVIESDIVDKLINFLQINDFKRKKAINRLFKLMELNLLTKEQVSLFADNLWKEIDEYGFPNNTGLYYWAFYKFPKYIIEKYKVFDKITKYFLVSLFPIQNKNINRSNMKFFSTITFDKEEVSLNYSYGVREHIFCNIISMTSMDYIFSKEVISHVFSECILWWNYDKKYLKNVSEEIAKEFKLRFFELVQIFAKVIFPHKDILTYEQKRDLDNIINEIEEYKIKGYLILKHIYNHKDIIYDIKKGLCSKNEQEISDLLETIIYLKHKNFTNIEQIITILVENIMYKIKPLLDYRIYTLSECLKRNIEKVDDKILKDLEFGLKHILTEIMISKKDIDSDVDNKIRCSIELTKLIYILKKYYINKCMDIPKYIIDWEQIFVNENEFSEIRNAWININIEDIENKN